MVRSYLITFGFLTFRLISDYPPGVDWGTFADRAATVTWACWAVLVMVYEVVLATKRLQGAVAKS